MKRSQGKWVARVFVFAIGAIACLPSARATVLQFNMTPYPGDTIGGYESTYASYGDNVTATSMAGPGVTYLYGMGNGFTPNIAVDYTSAAGGSGGHSAFHAQGGWSAPVDYMRYFDGSTFWFTFTPSGGFGVDVNSFDIDLYSGVGQVDWKLRQDTTSGTVFASGTEAALSVSDPDRVVNIPNGSYHGTTVLEIIISGTGNAGNIGIRNLNFDQLAIPAPEPTSGLLLAFGMVGMIVRKRKGA